MDLHRRALALSSVLLVCALAIGVAQEPLAPARVGLTSEEMEAFLLKASIIGRKISAKGVTKPVQATLSDGTVTHDAQIQTVDESRALFEAGKASEVGFRDTYKFNIAGYRLARLLGLRNVPMSVERRVDSKDAAVTWWVDDFLMDESDRLKLKTMGADSDRVSKQLQVMRVWDELIQNRDRNQGNILWTNDWTLWMIDHTRAFRRGDQVLKPDQLTRCDRAFLDAMRRLTPEDMTQVARGGMLTKDEAAAVLKRRDRIVKHFEDRIATRGEAAVLFTLAN
jgi:hypothetical protein